MRRSATLSGLSLVSLVTLVALGCGGGGYGSGSSYSGGSSGGTGIATSITISPAVASVAVNGMQQFTAVSKDSSGTTLSGVTLTWASSNGAVATIDTNGNATAVGVGTTSITASVTYSSGGVYTTGPGTTYTSNMATLTVTTVDAVMGTAATGHALAGVVITLKDADGKTATTLSGDDGRFSFSTAGLKAPFLLRADDGRGRTLFGAAAAAGGANLDTVTDLMLRAWYLAHGSTPEAAFADMVDHPAPDAKALFLLDKQFAGLLSTALAAEGLDSRSFNLFTTAFNADGSGFDAVLDHSRALTGAQLQLQDGLAGQMTDIGIEGKTMSFSTHGMGDGTTLMQRFELP